jgi:hypothetical protein
MVVLADMSGPFPCVMVFAFVVIAAIAIVMAIVKGRAQREAMARLAAELGLTYYRDDPWDIPERYSRFDLFQEGHSRKASNVLAGRADGREVIVCDYQYSTGSGKNQTTHYCQAAIVALPITAPRLSLRRETVLDRIASWVGHDDINFESAEFSRRYYVKCEEPKFAYDIFHVRLIEYLLACGQAPAMEMGGPLLLLWETRGKPENLRRLLTIGSQIITSIPEYVLTARGIQGKAGGGR